MNTKGTVIFVSHQRSFTEKVATSVVEVNNGEVIRFTGAYQDYLQGLEEETDLTNVGSPDAAKKKNNSFEKKPTKENW